MRARVLDAAVECLADVGYSQTTVTEVARRAGVSRGGPTHHFRSRDELFVSALGHVFVRLADEAAAAVATIEDDHNRATAMIDVLWKLFQGPTFVAWLEMALASRADPLLAERMTALQEEFSATVAEQFRRLFDDTGSATGAAGVAALFALLQGLAVWKLVPGAPDLSDMVLGVAKMIAASPGLARGSGT